MTRVDFPDFTVRSPSGEFELAARSADNEGEYLAGWQAGFEFTLVRGGKVAWHARQHRREPSPRHAWVSDDGWVVVRLHGHSVGGLRVMSPTGEEVLQVRIYQEIRAEGSEPQVRGVRRADWSDAHCSMSTAGLLWAGLGYGHFFTSTGQRWFAFRTAWGRRIAIQLAEGRLAADDESCFTADALAAEHAWAVHVVARAVAQSPIAEAVSAIVIAGEDRLLEAGAALHEIDEACGFEAWRSSSAVDGWLIERRWLATAAQWALRRIGTHGPLPPVFRFVGAGNKGRPVPPVPVVPALFSRPVVRAGDVDRSMTPPSVIETLGVPNHVRHDAEQVSTKRWTALELWEYDFAAGGERWTTRIVWSHLLSSRIVDAYDLPPGWESHSRRDDLFLP
ncbi:MAG: hypothetical protein HYV09_36285 [Deltaproteobacteria bacterium]|nr:hypothetical protein [Deltaproteobacteria bacterium]